MRSTVKTLQVTLTFLAADKVAGKHIVSSMLGSLAVDGIKATAGPVVEAADQSVITVYTDGGCDLRKDGIGAWAYTSVGGGEADGVDPTCSHRLSFPRRVYLGTTWNGSELTSWLPVGSVTATRST